MALSEHEQKLLDQIERDMYSPEHNAVATSPANRARATLRPTILAIAGVAAGLTLVMVGLVGNVVVVSVLGFVVIVGAAAMAKIAPTDIRARLAASVAVQTRKLPDGFRPTEKPPSPRPMDDA